MALIPGNPRAMNGKIIKAYPIALGLNPNPYIIYWP